MGTKATAARFKRSRRNGATTTNLQRELVVKSTTSSENIEPIKSPAAESDDTNTLFHIDEHFHTLKTSSIQSWVIGICHRWRSHQTASFTLENSFSLATKATANEITCNGDKYIGVISHASVFDEMLISIEKPTRKCDKWRNRVAAAFHFWRPINE